MGFGQPSASAKTERPPDAINSLSITADGCFALCFAHKTGYFWDLKSDTEVWQIQAPDETWFGGALLLPDELRALLAVKDLSSRNSYLCLWDIRSRMTIRRFQYEGFSPQSMFVTSDAKKIVSTFGFNTVLVWELETGRLLHNFDVRSIKTYVTIGTVTPDEYVVLFSRHLSWSNDTALRLWHLKDASEVCAFIAEAEITCCAAIDARNFVAGDSIGQIHFLRLVLPQDPVDHSNHPNAGRRGHF